MMVERALDEVAVKGLEAASENSKQIYLMLSLFQEEKVGQNELIHLVIENQDFLKSLLNDKSKSGGWIVARWMFSASTIIAGGAAMVAGAFLSSDMNPNNLETVAFVVGGALLSASLIPLGEWIVRRRGKGDGKG